MSERLLELDHVGVGQFQKEAILEAAVHANRRIFEILLQKPGAVLEQQVLTRAARFGHVWLVEFLLKSPMIRAGAASNAALTNAVQGRHIPIIDRLLQEPEVFANAQLAVNAAAKSGNVEILDYLLKKPIQVNNEVIQESLIGGYAPVVYRLLRDERNFQVDPKWLKQATTFAYLDVVERLLQLPHIANHVLRQSDPSQATRDACALSLCFRDGKRYIQGDYQTAFLTSYWVFKDMHSAPDFVIHLVHEYLWQGSLTREVVRISSQMRELLDRLRKSKMIAE
eukprot:TRINITY_DN2272_c0_g1_i1.p1 TRINITY_DN2272_c0_g1~~TRINITY_DN2272_c0_g1_i1.p1  ORF type:complete len:282 (+),score=29.34 TRINITY_DN2272_c0_g1_i1:185-1030(+)